MQAQRYFFHYTTVISIFIPPKLGQLIRITKSALYFIKIYDTLLPTAINSDKADPNYSKTIRDKAYTHLKALVDKIRETGFRFDT
jgi:hypothetical protein